MPKQETPVALFSVKATEMQARLHELLKQQTKAVQVTYQGEPAAVVLPWKLYLALSPAHAFNEALLNHTSMAISQVRLLFLSYLNRIAPVLEDGKILTITCNKKNVGVVIAWSTWLQYGVEWTIESDDVRSFTVVGARNRMLQFPDQFAEEALLGLYAPIQVTKQGHPVLAIVPWEWYVLAKQYILEEKQ